MKLCACFALLFPDLALRSTGFNFSLTIKPSPAFGFTCCGAPNNTRNTNKDADNDKERTIFRVHERENHQLLPKSISSIPYLWGVVKRSFILWKRPKNESVIKTTNRDHYGEAYIKTCKYFNWKLRHSCTELTSTFGLLWRR